MAPKLVGHPPHPLLGLELLGLVNGGDLLELGHQRLGAAAAIMHENDGNAGGGIHRKLEDKIGGFLPRILQLGEHHDAVLPEKRGAAQLDELRLGHIPSPQGGDHEVLPLRRLLFELGHNVEASAFGQKLFGTDDEVHLRIGRDGGGHGFTLYGQKLPSAACWVPSS